MEHIAFDSILRSNLPHHEKRNIVKDWVSKAMHSVSSEAHHLSHPARHSMAHTALTGITGGVLGGALGLAHANLPKGGLDVKLGKFDIPVDGIIGLLGALGAHYASSDEGVSAGEAALATAFGVLSFRKTMDLSAEIKAKHGGTNTGTVGVTKSAPAAHGDFGEDPIIKAARAL